MAGVCQPDGRRITGRTLGTPPSASGAACRPPNRGPAPGLPGHAAEATHHALHATLARQFLHHLLHLPVLPEQPIDVDQVGSGTRGNPPLA